VISLKALAIGAQTVMLGTFSPAWRKATGDVIYYQGRQYKEYRGNGSVEAMKEGGRDRYFQDAGQPTKLVL